MKRLIATLCALALLAAGASGQSRPEIIAPSPAVHAKNGMVVAQEARAARIGVEILKRGGNAIDAAVAVGFAMAVTYPRAGNIGGGGFMLIHLAASNENLAVDYRETAPAAAMPTMFLDDQGNPDPKKSRDSPLSIGVPGTVAGLALAETKYGSGKFSLADLIAPAIALAESGIPVENDVADSLPSVAERLARWPASAAIFMKNGAVLAPGDRLVQPDLAAVLRAIAQDGPAGFYEGDVARKLVNAIRAAGGIMSVDDLRNYRAAIRKPVRGNYRGYDIVSMPPPSSGGIALIEMLNILEDYDLAKAPRADALHWMIEAMARAYADRATFLGDPAAVDVPLKGLISKRYAAALRETITAKATPAAEIQAGNPEDYEGDNTTHFSVIDRDGNAVSNTYTLNFSYGLGMVAAGTGILLNNELDDFTAKAGAANAYGLIGFEANLPGPGKRPLSSMSPTIVLKDGKPMLITGSPGGSRIITAVLQILVDTLDFGMTIDGAVSAPRLHNQWQPDEVLVEPGFAPVILQSLTERGHKIVPTQPGTSANSIAVGSGGYIGAADGRTRGALAAGY